MIRTSTLLWFSQNSGVPSDAVIATLAKYDVVYTWQFTDTRVGSSGVLDLSWTDAIIARIRAVNPKVKLGLYGGQSPIFTDLDPSFAWVPNADLFHDPTGAPLIYEVSNGYQNVFKFPNLLYQRVRLALVDKWADLLDEHDLDCLMLDSAIPSYPAMLIREPPASHGYFGLDGGIEQGWRMDTEDWWCSTMGIWGDQLRWGLEQRGLSVIVVGMYPFPSWTQSNATDVWCGFGFSNLVDHASGAIVEHCVEGYGNPDVFRDLLRTIKLATGKRRDVFVYALPWMLTQAYPTIHTPEFARFMLAGYLLVQEPPYTSYGYSDVVPFRGFDGGDPDGPGEPYVYWSDDWDRDYGQPLEPYQAISTTNTLNDPTATLRLAWRSYSRGNTETTDTIVVVNPTITAQTITFGGSWRIWDSVSGPVVSASPLTVPATTGWVLFAQP